MSILVIAEFDAAGLKAATLSTLTAARACGAEIDVLVAGRHTEAAVAAAARQAGVRRVLQADGESLADGLAEALAAQVLAVLAVLEADGGACTHVLFAATAQGRNVAPRVATLRGVSQVSDVIRVIAPDTYERPIYAGNAIATVRSGDPLQVLTVRATAFPADASLGGAATVETVPVVEAPARSRVLRRELARSERPELTSAKVVVSGGRALGSAEQFQAVLAPLADTLGAALGASRAAVDAGYAPNDWQVGQTGKIVAPQLYVAAGISGAIQHLAGMKDARFIVAINKDPEAPIFGIADYGLEADLFSAVPELTAQLGAGRAGSQAAV